MHTRQLSRELDHPPVGLPGILQDSNLGLIPPQDRRLVSRQVHRQGHHQAHGLQDHHPSTPTVGEEGEDPREGQAHHQDHLEATSPRATQLGLGELSRMGRHTKR